MAETLGVVGGPGAGAPPPPEGRGSYKKAVYKTNKIFLWGGVCV